MSMLLAFTTAVNGTSSDPPPTSSNSATVLSVVVISALLIAYTALSSSGIESLISIAVTALRALLAELRGLIVIFLALLLVLAAEDNVSPHLYR